MHCRRCKVWILIKRLICFTVLYIFLSWTGLLGAILSVANNIHWIENYELDNVKYRTELEMPRKPRMYFGKRPLCDEIPPRLIGKVPFLNEEPDMTIVEMINNEVQYGTYEHRTCESRYHVAIIVPLRGREKNFRRMLAHMHPIWQRQEISYTMFVITQAGMHTFNKAKLMNAGFKEASKYNVYDCYVFHDVDALLEDDRCLYTCEYENPRHLCAYADVFSYKEVSYSLPCRPLFSPNTKLFGGVTMFTRAQFIRVNGFSNLYWGWGGEDDDMYDRLRNAGYTIVNPHGRYCSYTLLQHPREVANAASDARQSLLYHSMRRQYKDGLGNVNYNVLSYDHHPLYINITVDIGRPSRIMEEFIKSTSKKWWHFFPCSFRMPWNYYTLR